MLLSRRTFLQTAGAGALATRLFAATADSTQPNPDLEILGRSLFAKPNGSRQPTVISESSATGGSP
jgi:hypothetical protein